MNSAMEELLSILDLERLEHNLYRGRSPQSGWQRVFGGQVIGQALVAAQRTVPAPFHVHSLHCYFMRPGDPAVPIIYEVDRIRDGRTFLTRRVNAIQHGHAIFTLVTSFQTPEEGLEFQFSMPEGVPPPEEVLTEKELVKAFIDDLPDNIRKWWERPRPIEMKPLQLEHFTSRKRLEPRQNTWIRATGPVPDDPPLQAAVLAYLSDMTLLDTALFVHGRAVFDRDLQVASLDHSMWFHRPANLDDWMLYTQDSPSTQGGRGMTRGFLYGRDGTLIASMAQEGLIRVRQND
ncbi:MAG: acyl-CoA thioesterase II [Notoacmeibacter sp.]|nr:acyl-CoA thioesterase II [Notoacmeibacter sp.]